MAISDKMLSGRYALTIIAGMCLLGFTLADCLCAMRGQSVPFDPSAIFTTVAGVIAFYFSKPPENPSKPTTGATGGVP